MCQCAVFGRERGFRLQRTGCNRLRLIFGVPCSPTLMLLTALTGIATARTASFAPKRPSVRFDRSQPDGIQRITTTNSPKHVHFKTSTTRRVAPDEFGDFFELAEPVRTPGIPGIIGTVATWVTSEEETAEPAPTYFRHSVASGKASGGCKPSGATPTTRRNVP